MNTQNNDLSYYALRLKELLNSSFPELASDEKFTEERSKHAAQTYESAFKAGNRIDQCQALADNVLFEGLYFSKFGTIFEVICQEFDTVMADEELRPFAIKMLPICATIFAQYELTDDFAYTTDYDMLYTELTGTIGLWIEENGLQ